MAIYIPPQGGITINESAIKNTDAEIRDGVWSDGTKVDGANISHIYGDTTTIIANTSTILDTVGNDATLENQSTLLQVNQTVDSVVDSILMNTSTLLLNTTEVSGFYNLSTSGGPHTVFTIDITERKRLNSLFLDLVNLSYANNIKIDHKIDGTNYRTIANMSWETTDDNGMYFNKNLAFSHDVRLTMSNGTSANVTVPYSYILESME